MKKLRILSVFFALVMCITSIRPIMAAENVFETTTYYSNDFEGENPLTGITNNMKSVKVEESNGNKVLSVVADKAAYLYLPNLSNVGVTDLVVEVEVATTTGAAKSFFRMNDSANNKTILLCIGGDKVYTNWADCNAGTNPIATLPTDGSFSRFCIKLIRDDQGVATKLEIYQYDKVENSWGTEPIGNFTLSGNTMAEPTKIQYYVAVAPDAEKTVQIDNWKIYREAIAFLSEGEGSSGEQDPVLGEEVIKLPANQYDDPDFYPTTGHPRLMFTAEDLPRIKANLTHEENAEAYAAFNALKAQVHDGMLDTTKVNSYDAQVASIIEAKAFDYVLNRDSTDAAVAAQAVQNGHAAISMLKNYLSTFQNEAGSGTYRQATYSIFVSAEVWDWCYDLLKDDVDTKNLIIAKCQKISEVYAEIGFPPDNQNAVTSHASETAGNNLYHQFNI